MTPEHKAKIAAALRALWADPTYRKRCTAGIRKAKCRPMKASTKRLIGDAQLRLWADPVWRAWQLEQRAGRFAELSPQEVEEWRQRSKVAMETYWEEAPPRKAAKHRKKLATNMSRIVKCPACGLEGGHVIMHRFHFDNCVPGRQTRKKKAQGL